DRIPKNASPGEAYASAVAHIVADKPFYEIGLPATRIAERLAFQPVIGQDYIRGSVTFIDNFENATTNISQELFERVGQGRAFELLIKRNEAIDGLSFRYHDVPEGETLIRFDSDGLLEIAINLGRAATLLGIAVEDTVQIEFR
ncbi:MAG: SAM hydroxide adenosyltransferase, partial [Bacteroidota bacterium]